MTHQKLVNEYFHDAAPYWREIYEAGAVQSAIYARRRDRVLAFIDGLNLAPGSLMLEAGCGAGATTITLARRGHLVTATDSVEAMLHMTRELARESGMDDKVCTELADINHLRFASGTFDVAAAIGVLPWLESLDAPVREIARVLKAGGYLIATVDNVLALNRIIDPRLSPAIEPVKRFLRTILSRSGWRNAPLRARAHSIRQLERALSRAGLKKIAGCTAGFGPFTFWNRELISNRRGHQLNDWLQRRADGGVPIPRSTGAHCIVLARKIATGKETP
ncbi:MAG: class I SAM-dependent methyltransferase [Bryobacteraceae bacterium]